MIKLYDMRRSGNAYKARLMLGLLGLPHELQTVNLATKEQFESWFLALNPLHTVPLLDDDGTLIRDSAAVLVYLAAKYDGARTWYPASPKGMAEVQQWLAYAGNEIVTQLSAVRAIGNGMRKGDLGEAQEKARGVLAHVDRSLTGREWLVGSDPTVADVACYPYCAMVWQGGIELTAYPAIANWCKRIEALTGYVALPPRPMAPDFL